MGDEWPCNDWTYKGFDEYYDDDGGENECDRIIRM
jgi:hypothetical protein